MLGSSKITLNKCAFICKTLACFKKFKNILVLCEKNIQIKYDME